MFPDIKTQRKYLLLLNRQLRTQLIPAPSKLSAEDVVKHFEMHMIAKDNYFVPKETNTLLKVDESLFMKLAPKSKAIPAPPPVVPKRPRKQLNPKRRVVVVPPTPMPVLKKY